MGKIYHSPSGDDKPVSKQAVRPIADRPQLSSLVHPLWGSSTVSNQCQILQWLYSGGGPVLQQIIGASLLAENLTFPVQYTSSFSLLKCPLWRSSTVCMAACVIQ